MWNRGEREGERDGWWCPCNPQAVYCGKVPYVIGAHRWVLHAWTCAASVAVLANCSAWLSRWKSRCSTPHSSKQAASRRRRCSMAWVRMAGSEWITACAQGVETEGTFKCGKRSQLMHSRAQPCRCKAAKGWSSLAVAQAARPPHCSSPHLQLSLAAGGAGALAGGARRALQLLPGLELQLEHGLAELRNEWGRGAAGVSMADKSAAAAVPTRDESRGWPPARQAARLQGLEPIPPSPSPHLLDGVVDHALVQLRQPTKLALHEGIRRLALLLGGGCKVLLRSMDGRSVMGQPAQRSDR